MVVEDVFADTAKWALLFTHMCPRRSARSSTTTIIQDLARPLWPRNMTMPAQAELLSLCSHGFLYSSWPPGVGESDARLPNPVVEALPTKNRKPFVGEGSFLVGHVRRRFCLSLTGWLVVVYLPAEAKTVF